MIMIIIMWERRVVGDGKLNLRMEIRDLKYIPNIHLENLEGEQDREILSYIRARVFLLCMFKRVVNVVEQASD